VERNAELSAMYPDAVGNIVHVDLADGRRITRRVDYPLGNAKNRLKDSAVEGKFLALVERIIGRAERKRLPSLFGNWMKPKRGCADAGHENDE